MPTRFNAPRFWFAVALLLTVAGALAGHAPADSPVPLHPALFSGAI